MTSEQRLRAGDWVAVGLHRIAVSQEFAQSLLEGDQVLAVASSGSLRRLPRDVIELVADAVGKARSAFEQLARMPDESINSFFDHAVHALADDKIFAQILKANQHDVSLALARGRSTTRLLLSDSMRRDMIDAFILWRDAPMSRDSVIDRIDHDGWSVEQRTAPLGVLGFVFEGRPNVFADATGVLKGGNTVVFRIGSDALGTATSMMDLIVKPALKLAGLPEHSIVLLNSPEHAAGWALFSDSRISLAVARGSGAAVAEMGSIAQQAGIPVSLHGTGGAWMLIGQSADVERLSLAVEHSLDRKVCNTLNVVCVLRDLAAIHIPIIVEASKAAGAKRGVHPRIHAINGAELFIESQGDIEVRRGEGLVVEPQISIQDMDTLSKEYEWEENPEFAIVIVESLDHGVHLFNQFSPQFIVSVISQDEPDHELVWTTINAPFVGNGFTRWVDGQFSLLRPELGLSNWERGRLFGRSGVLSGDSPFSVRMRVHQTDPSVHR